MSIAIVAIAGALFTGVRIADIHRKTSTATAVLRAYAEALQTRVAAGGYVDATCATASSYTNFYTPPAGFTAVPIAVWFWSPSESTFVNHCPDVGVQRVTLQVTTPDPRVAISETLDVVIRKP